MWALPISSSCQNALLVMLSQNHCESSLVTGHLWALPHHELDQPSAPHKQAAILSTAQHLQQNSPLMTHLQMHQLTQQLAFLDVALAAAAAVEHL